jgi:hypothetical protein
MATVIVLLGLLSLVVLLVGMFHYGYQGGFYHGEWSMHLKARKQDLCPSCRNKINQIKVH